MPEPKKPFHEVVGFKLLTAPIGITGGLEREKTAEVMTLLGILEESKMPATAAHKIAEDNHRLPELLRDIGQTTLAELADVVLKDLRGRQDEPKKETAPAT